MLCPLTGTSPNGVATAEASPLIVTALSQHIEFIAWQLIPSSTHPNSLTFPPDMLSLNPAIKHFTKSIPFLSITYPNHLTVADITRFTIQSLSCYIHTKIHKHLHITFHLNTPHAPLTYLILTVHTCDCTCDSLPQILTHTWLWCASKDTLKFPLNTHQLQHTALGE